jgi:hypothetical protein
MACHHVEVADAVTRVLEARKRYDQARVDALKLVERHRAALGLEIRLARQDGTSQTEILTAMGKSREQVRAFEKAWRDWDRDHPGIDPR